MTTTLPAPAPAPLATRPAITLMPHQQQALDFMTSRPSSAVWVDIGGGKTLSTLSWLQLVRPMGHILVIAPKAIARSVWIDEIEDWGFPIRTRSLIVDERDKELPVADRLQRMREVFTDPPTMYFINQEMITQPSRTTNKLVAHASAPQGLQLGDQAQQILDLLLTVGPTPKDMVIQAYRAFTASQPGAKKPISKAAVDRALKELTTADLVTNEAFACDLCAGEGCANCRFGLVDQMPIQKMIFSDGSVRDAINWPFQTVIIDESQEFKSHDSQRFKALAAVRPSIQRFIELTGTPTPNGYHDLWAQMYLLDQGQALGHNITAFRDRWFTAKMVPGTNTPASWIPNPGAEQEIQQAIKHLVISAENKSLNLDDPIVNDVKVSLPADLKDAYKTFKKDLVLEVVNTAVQIQARVSYDQWLENSDEDEAEELRQILSAFSGLDYDELYEKLFDERIKRFIGDPSMNTVQTVIAQNQAVLTSKLMQFASGTLYTADPDDPSTAGQYQVLHDEKIKMVEYIVRNNNGSPILLAYHFKSDLEQLLLKLKKAGIDARKFDGSRGMVQQWNAGQIPVMLLHPASAGPGLNLQKGGQTLIWYTLPFSLKHYQQLNGRLHRTGQKNQVTIHRMITRGTQDERMPTVLMDKQNTQDGLLAAVDADIVMLEALTAEINEELNELWTTSRL